MTFTNIHWGAIPVLSDVADMYYANFFHSGLSILEMSLSGTRNIMYCSLKLDNWCVPLLLFIIEYCQHGVFTRRMHGLSDWSE